MSTIEDADPVADHLAVHRRVTAREFPWDYGRGLEMAMLRSCAVPSVARVLASSGEFRHCGQRRYDDTRILLGEIVRHGYDSPRGRQAIRCINLAHRSYDITNDDMLYVLSTFVFEPVRWIDRWARRSMTETECQAGFHFYRAVGRRLAVRGIPAEYGEFERFNRDYEERNFASTGDTRRVAEDVLSVYVSMYPTPSRPLVRHLWAARLERHARDALGIPCPPGWARLLNAGILNGHAAFERIAPQWSARTFARPDARSYPDGYRLREVGPATMMPE